MLIFLTIFQNKCSKFSFYKQIIVFSSTGHQKYHQKCKCGTCKCKNDKTADDLDSNDKVSDDIESDGCLSFDDSSMFNTVMVFISMDVDGKPIYFNHDTNSSMGIRPLRFCFQKGI